MISRKVLNATGCTTARLRQIFTADAATPDGKIRKKFEDQIMSRVSSGMTECAKRSNLWQAVDLAWDSTPIQPETIPLLLWAQGKIKKDVLVRDLEGARCSTEYLTTCKDSTGQEVIKVDIPRLYEVSINLIRTMVTRRLAAQTTRFSNLWPYFRYEPRGTDMVSKLRGDALSERIDVMSNAYNYRHFFPQTFRHHFMYGRSVIFPRCAWDKTTSWRAKNTNLPDAEIELESYVTREGIDFVAPHISRVFWDNSAPLPNVNTDNGPTYIGYWDIIPYSTIKNQDGYWNTDKVTCSESSAGVLSSYGPFFSYYFSESVLTWPERKLDPTAGNDRVKSIGSYTSTDDDKGMLFTQYFVKVNPKREGISTGIGKDSAKALNCDVWMRLVVSGDNTVIGGEFLTSLPACYGGLNENDDRMVNMSMAMEIMPFQDQLTNLFSQMLHNIRAGLLQIWAIDQDALEPEMRAHIEKTLAAKNYYTEPQAFFYSGAKLRELGVQNPADNPRAFLTIIQAQIQTSIETSMKAIAQCLDMADRILLMSPNERGQPNPREVAAREITEISTTTNSTHTFISDGIDEQRAAVKRLCYESLVSEETSTFRVPVISRYTVKTVKEAGFEVKGDWNTDAILPLKTPIIGNVAGLIYDYYFDSRDGADRAVNSQGAQVLGNLLGQFAQSPEIMKAMGRRRLFEMVNEITRLSGAAFDLKLDEGESEDMPLEGELSERVARIEQLLKSIAGGPPPQGQGTQPGGEPPPPPPSPAEPAAEDTGGELPAGLKSVA